MRQVVLDTETTGLEAEKGHKVIEIGAVEIINQHPQRCHTQRAGRIFVPAHLIHRSAGATLLRAHGDHGHAIHHYHGHHGLHRRALHSVGSRQAPALGRSVLLVGHLTPQRTLGFLI